MEFFSGAVLKVELWGWRTLPGKPILTGGSALQLKPGRNLATLASQLFILKYFKIISWLIKQCPPKRVIYAIIMVNGIGTFFFSLNAKIIEQLFVFFFSWGESSDILLDTLGDERPIIGARHVA